MKPRLKANGIIISFAFLCILLFPSVFLRSGRITYPEEVAKVFGIIFVFTGQLLRVSGRGFKSENSAEGERLIQGGPYALVRNPMYLGILCIGLGIVTMLFKWWVAFIFLVIFSWRYWLLMLSEEKKLTSLFSQEYQDYQRKVPRLFPSPIKLLRHNIAEYLPMKLSWLKKEAGTMFAVILAVLLLQGWAEMQRGGIKAFIKVSALNFIAIIFFLGLIIYLIRETLKRCFK